MINHYSNIIRLLAIIAAGIILGGCATAPKILIKEFDGRSTIKKGEEATLRWHFENAEYVEVDGFALDFDPADSLKVSPDSTRQYHITARRSETEMIRQNWIVEVLPDDEDIQTGPQFLKEDKYEPSYEYSSYFTGIQPAGMDIAPEYLKVMRVIYPEAENAPFLVRGLILDEFGNYIPDYSAQDKPLEWSAIHYCKMGVLGKPHNDFSKQEFEPMRPPLEISVLLDNSAAADNNYLAFDYIKDYIFRLSPTDKVSCAYYNHLYHELLPSHFAKKAALILSEKDIPRPSGLSGLFRAAYHSLKDMENGGDNSTDALMIITFSPDNSSLIYDANDVAMLARSKGIPIYIIAVGSAIHSYPLRYMAGYSGGRYYNIPDEKVQDIYDIMREIVFSRRAYYEFELPADDPDFSRCRKSKSELTIETRKSSASDEFYIYKDPLPQYMPYQAVAAFGYRDTTVSQEFYPLIESLAKVLMDNLDFGIELIGHSSIEGNEQLNRMFSVKRAEAVKRLIVSHGVPADQIRVRGEGANQPIYYLQQIPWQQYYNRRVEIRWLDPAMKPFEIIADRNWTETDALEDVEKWEKKGYNAYFERYLRNNIPVYRVKLWGYATIEEARNEVESLSSKYDIKFEVE